MSDIATRTPADLERHVPAGARPLGVRVKPTMRLGLGIKDPDRGFPIKTDYLTVRSDNARALQKFQDVYGEQPKAVEITLRPELNASLDIRYRAFGGGQHGDGGGMIKAVGHTNFALLDYMGGPDAITVFAPSGIEILQIDGKDDEQAQALGIELALQFTFGLPKVLSYGSIAAVSTRGKESIDTLWAKLREWHALAHWLQAPISRVTGQPLLILKPSSMMAPKFEGKGKEKKRAGWQKSPLWVLDLVLQETQDEMVARVLAERQKTLDAGGAQAMLYGARRVQELAAGGPPADDAFDPDEYESVEGELVDDDTPAGMPADNGPQEAAVDQQAADGDSSGDTSAAPAAVPGEPALPVEPAASAFKAPAAAVAKAGKVKPPHGAWAGLTLAAILAAGEAGEAWFRWSLGEEWPDGFRANLHLFVRAELPDVWAQHVASGGQS